MARCWNSVRRDPPTGPVNVLDKVTLPAKPAVAAGLPRLEDEILAPPLVAVVIETLVTFDDRV
jgi:hypothetical protein